MEQNAYVMEALSGVIYLVLGVRVYWSSRRSIQLSDSYMGLALLTWALGYALYDIPYALAASDELVPPLFAFTSILAFNLGNVFLAMFTQEVFRKHESWAGWVVVAMALCMFLGSFGAVWIGDWELVDPLENFGYWPQTLANLLPAAWLAYEGLSQSLNSRRRITLGFLEPSARHRVLLLGLTGAFWTLLELVIVVQDFIYINVGDWSGVLGIVNGLLELVPMIFLWLAFFPPALYQRWVVGPEPA
jgi:hypothetical protein